MTCCWFDSTVWRCTKTCQRLSRDMIGALPLKYALTYFFTEIQIFLLHTIVSIAITFTLVQITTDNAIIELNWSYCLHEDLQPKKKKMLLSEWMTFLQASSIYCFICLTCVNFQWNTYLLEECPYQILCVEQFRFHKLSYIAYFLG